MGNNHYEKDYDDEVYEDDYYDEHYNEEELADDEEGGDSGDSSIVEDGDKFEDEKKVVMGFACEDCDYRWEDQIIKSKNAFDEDDDPDAVCPMCGSMNVTQI